MTFRPRSLHLNARSNAIIVGLALTLAVVSGCTKPRQTTAIGSGVGGAIGAGLGAIVGNQTGNAGSGLAIGAGAGAAVGALVGNALQAQEERNATQDEAIKRQERVIQAQKSEIGELRAVRGDDSYSYNTTPPAAPRYRYRGTMISPESPEVARQRARLQQRGPRPTHTSGSTIYSSSYYSSSHQEPGTPSRTATISAQPVRRTTTTEVRPPAATLPSATVSTTKPLARYDVRSELSETSTSPSRAQTSADTPDRVGTEIKQAAVTKASVQSGGISESDLPAPSKPADTTARAAAPVAPSQPHSKECKEALSERDRAMEAADNSDKLFHLRRALRLCPQSAPLHHELGKVYASMQRTRDAEEEFKEALSLDPSLSAAKRELSALLKDEVQF
jgi:hypothetical protein